MKPLLLILALCAPLSAQTPQTKDQIRLQRQQEKEAEKQRQREEKERLKRPATIRIQGPADRVSALIVQYMNGANYQIVEEGKYRLVFNQEVAGFRGAMVGGLAGADGLPLRTVAFTVSQFGDTSTVTADLSVQIRKAFGRVNRIDMNKNKEWRAELDNLLTNLKYAIEDSKP